MAIDFTRDLTKGSRRSDSVETALDTATTGLRLASRFFELFFYRASLRRFRHEFHRLRAHVLLDLRREFFTVRDWKIYTCSFVVFVLFL